VTHHLSDNGLVRPPFAERPPIRVNLDARLLGLVLTILGIVAAVVSLLFVLGVSSLCNGLVLCSFPTLDVAGTVLLTAGWVVMTVGVVMMLTLPGVAGSRAVAVYGLVLAAAGDVLSLVGNIVFVGANSLYYRLGDGSIVIFVFWLVVSAILYYLVVTSRPAGEPPAS
jgi:hypothetical protein